MNNGANAKINQGTDGNEKDNNTQKNDRNVNYEIDVIGTQKQGETVKAGGVDTDFIDAKSMQSKVVKNLFVIGELLNVLEEFYSKWINAYDPKWSICTGDKFAIILIFALNISQSCK